MPTVHASIADLKVACKPRDLLGFVNDAGLPSRTNDEALTALDDADIIATLEAFLADASSEVDGYVLGHADTDDATISGLLKPHVVAFCLFNLATRAQMEPGEGLATRYDTSRKYLTDVARGRKILRQDPEVPGPTARAAGQTKTRVFSNDALADFFEFPE